MATVKCEVQNVGKHDLNIAYVETQEIKCVKRRRREPTRPIIGCDARQGEQQTPHVDRSTTGTSTSTVKRSSRFRGVSKHRWTGRYEAHLWDKASWNVTQKKKGKQVYLGAYDEEESAARAYDLAAIKYWGLKTFTNFPVAQYETEIPLMQNVTKEEYLATLRRKSSGFARGVSKYRGVARHHHNGRWEARIGRVFGNKYLYLGTYGTQEEAAHAYDIAAIEYRGVNAVTNFDLSTYIRSLRPEVNAVHPPSYSQKTVSSPLFPSSSNIITDNEPELFFRTNAFNTDVLDCPQDDECFVQKRQVSIPSPKSSSPTALSLLLRSSLFKELVEKNSSASDNDDEIEGDDTKHPAPIKSEDEYGGIFYEGITDTPYEGFSNDSILSIQMLEGQSSFYNQQALWNDVLNMSFVP